MDYIKRTISDAVAELKRLEQKVRDQKVLLNGLYRMAGENEPFADADIDQSTSAGSAIRSDQFYGQPLATVVRLILNMRKAAELGAATVGEIYAMMLDGGYHFETANEENRKRALRISLSKNPIFHKLQNGRYGLREWYPAIKDAKGRSGKACEEPEGSSEFEFEKKERELDEHDLESVDTEKPPA